MIVEKQKEAKVLQEGTSQGSTAMSLDMDSAQILMQMLSKNLYSDPIGSTIRECASNALDSHRRSGTTKPIIVGFSSNSSGNYEFTVEDFGIGLDNLDVENIISKYGKSTKRESDTELGMMGLGFKAPLAYSSSFYFICRKDGMERKYMMYEGEDVNTIDLLYETSTSEDNGVKIIVPVNYLDKGTFIQKIKEQLAYFESVYFDVNLPYDTVKNEFSIFRSEHFQYSELAQDEDMHLCLDNVYYPLDFSKLGIGRINLKIGLRFGLSDGIFPTPNRESLRYTEDAKSKILDKIKLVADHLITLYNSSIKDSEDIKGVMDHYYHSSKYLNMNNVKFNISHILQFSNVKLIDPNLVGFKHLSGKKIYDIRFNILDDYRIKYKLYRSTLSTKIHFDKITSPMNLDDDTFYIYDEPIKGMKKNYLKHILNNSTQYNFIKRTEKDMPLFPKSKGDQRNYHFILGLAVHPKSTWRERIKEFQKLTELSLKDIKSIDDIIVPQDWIDAQKKIRATVSKATGRRKAKGEFNCKLAETLLRYVDDKDCKFTPTIFKFEDLHKEKSLFIYDLHENAANLDPLYKLVVRQPIKLITLSGRETKLIESFDINNLMIFETFMKGDNKPFRRMATAFLINNLIKQHNNVFIKSSVVSRLSIPLGDNLELLKNYKDKNFHTGNETVAKAILQIAEGNNLFDHEIYYIYKQVKETLERLSFLNVLLSRMVKYESDDELVNIIMELCKRFKFRMNYQNYLPQEELTTTPE
jgi:hypothetical protein